jgi:hypothetical protein
MSSEMRKGALKKINSRLERLEAAVFRAHPKRAEKKAGNGLPARILKLRDQDFFKKPQTASEVHRKLQAQYPCELNRVAVALLRIQSRKGLRKTSKVLGKVKQIAYVW